MGGPLLMGGHQPLSDWGSPPPARPASNSGPGVSGVGGVGGVATSRPGSRQSQASTPRPPSVSAFSPAQLHPVLSPAGGGGGGGGGVPSTSTQPSPASMATPFSNNFPFSPLEGRRTPNTNPGTPSFYHADAEPTPLAPPLLLRDSKVGSRRKTWWTRREAEPEPERWVSSEEASGGP